MSKRWWFGFVCGAVVAILQGTPAHAVGSDSKTFISADNAFYAYVQAGETIDASFLRTNLDDEGGIPPLDVTVTLDGPGLKTQTCDAPVTIPVGQGCTFSGVVAPKAGIYRVVFTPGPTAAPYPQVAPQVRWQGHLYSWNITVKDGGVEKPGRVWTELYALRQPSPPQYLDNYLFYDVSQSGYIYKSTFEGFNGEISTLNADAVGNRNGNGCTPVYQSVEANDPNNAPAFGACGGAYKMFFEQPSGDLPASAATWDGKTDWIEPAIAQPQVSDLKFTSDGAKNGQQSGKITFKLQHFIGNYRIRIDTANNGSFDGPDDISISRSMKSFSDDTQTIEFSGVNGTGQVIAPNQEIGIQVDIEKVAEIHLINADIEGLTGGLELERLNGNNAPTYRMCWDDTHLAAIALSDAQFTTAKPDGRNCPDSTGGVHGWGFATGSWGDNRYIDDWAFASANVLGTTQIVYQPSVAAQQLGGGGPLLIELLSIVVGTILLIVAVGFGVAVIHRHRLQRQIANAEQRVMPPSEDPTRLRSPSEQPPPRPPYINHGS